MNTDVRTELQDLMPCNAQLQVDVISTVESWSQIAPHWKSLCAQSSTAHPFNSCEWIDAWWSIFGTNRQVLQIWTLWDNDQLVAALPMYKQPAGFLNRWCLFFIGTGENRADEVATEYSDVIVLPGYEAQVLPLALQWLQSFGSWHRAELLCLLEEGLLYQALKRHTPRVQRLELATGFRYRVPLEGEQSELELMGSSNSKRIRRSLKAIDRDGGFKRVCASKTGDVSQSLQRLIEMNRQRQGTKNRKSAFESTAFLQFHQRVFNQLVSLGQADILSYYLQDELMAVVYCFYDKDTVYYYQSGFSTQASNKYMPLTAAHLIEAAEARASNRKFYDLMRAEVPTYKAAMASNVEPLFNVYLFSNNFFLQAYTLMRSVRRLAVSTLKKLGIERR